MAQVRWNPQKYPYLLAPSFISWQDTPMNLVPPLARQHNVKGGPINVWVSSSANAFPCTTTCYAMATNGWTPLSPGDSPKWNASQVRWLPLKTVAV